MALSVQQFTSTGTENHVILSFPYLQKQDVHLYFNSVETPFTWASDSRIEFSPAPVGVEVTIKRTTPRDKLNYLLQEGAPFTRQVLDTIHTQLLYLEQEGFEGSISDIYGDVDMHGFRIRGAGAPIAASDYTTKAWVESSILDAQLGGGGLGAEVQAQIIEALRRGYAEAGYNVVGTFKGGFTYTSSADIGIDTRTGIGYTGPIGPVAAGTDPTAGGFTAVDGKLLRTRLMRTSMLGITTVEALLALPDFVKGVVVDSQLTLSSAATIPTGLVVTAEGGVVVVENSAAQIKVTPNSKWYVDVNCGGYAPEGLFHIDGKITTPMRWYVGEHETVVKCKVSSSVTSGVCVHLDATCSADTRARISGLDVDIVLSKMEYGVKLTVDRTAYTGPETGNAYITSNCIRINAAGTLRLLHEQYSGDGVTRPINEEIAANYYDLAHQPRSGVANYPIRMVGRLQRAVCSLWDSATATNTSDQIQIFGNDCVIEGPNLPALNSGYVSIVGARCRYAGVSYGTPRDRFNAIELERGAFVKCGATNIALGGVVSASSQSIPIRGLSAADGVVVLSKTLAPLANQLPLVIDIDVCASMVNAHPYRCQVTVGGATLQHEAVGVTGVLNQVKIVIDGDSVSISSIAGGAVSQITAAAFTSPIVLTVTVFSDSSGTDCGYLRSHSAKVWLAGV